MQVPSSSSNRGRIGSDLSLSMSDQQQWQAGPPHLLATAAASSGFPQQIRPSQGWLQKNGFHSLMRPSWPSRYYFYHAIFHLKNNLPLFVLWACMYEWMQFRLLFMLCPTSPFFRKSPYITVTLLLGERIGRAKLGTHSGLVIGQSN